MIFEYIKTQNIIWRVSVIISSKYFLAFVVLLKRESKELEKNIALYESNPMHYRNFMEPPPAYEYLDPPPETKKEDESDFLQNRQRISRISRTVSALRIEKVNEEAKKSQEKSIPEDRRLKRVHSALWTRMQHQRSWVEFETLTKRLQIPYVVF